MCLSFARVTLYICAEITNFNQLKKLWKNLEFQNMRANFATH
jgi:hypothetical protein